MISTFDFQPVLNGGDISIRPLIDNDFDELYNCASDKKLWEGHPAKERYKKGEFLKWFKSAMQSNSTVVFLDNVTNKLIGSSRFYIIDLAPNDISIGYTFLDRNYWGGKTNFELKKLMLDYAFSHFDRVWFHIAPSNIRSQKATEKIGGVFSHEKIAQISGKPDHWLFYKIEKNNWQLQSINT
jgi:RimJ/RimL family protein N-acetyltransferase